MSNSPETEEATVRRAPKFPAFMIVGGGIGAIVTFIATSLFPVDPSVGFAALFGYFSLFGISAGVVIGALLAMVFDRISTKRATAVQVEIDHISGEAPPN